MYLKNFWAGKVEGGDFNQMLHDGVYNGPAADAGAPAYGGNVTLLADAIGKSGNATGTDLVLYTSVGMQDGNSGNNPWLYELPDPISKVAWDNYVSLPKAMAEKLGIDKDDTVDLEFNGVRLNNVPALVQPGQANDTIGLALGFGRWAAGKVGGSREKDFDTVGHNAYPFMGLDRRRVISGVKVSKGADSYVLAQTQTHHSIEGRDLVRESTYEAWNKNPNAGNDKPHPHIYTIWEKPEYRKDGAPNHLWAMAIDLNACTGCGSCVISCHIENNVPVVGRNEVRKRREMHWLRIDRYYSFTNTDKKQFEGDYLTREKQIGKIDDAQGDNGAYAHWENVQVIHQPMLCQHCGNAPCETVCPVLATTHSSEGLNQMTYNRCIGTKYCGNNCPYKVRRFNWFRFNDNDNFDFHFNNPLGKMVINPDVTVRTRGVMEKCSFCVQRIQDSKLRAKRENRDKDTVVVETACQRACPANAIVFGDLHNPDSEVARLSRNERGFTVLEELNVKSSITYLTKIRNTANV
jgi:molybdopterin-containing oxidoreductase family iron-sulfur binding subunit